MEYNQENVYTVAQKLIDDMSLNDLTSYVYSDLIASFQRDASAFDDAVEHLNLNH